MKCFPRGWLAILIAVLLITLWYQRLPLRKKQFVQNLVQQIPDLPARYQV